jgi:hypothetical protein
MKIEKKTLKILSMVVVLRVFFVPHSKSKLDSEVNFFFLGNEMDLPVVAEKLNEDILV